MQHGQHAESPPSVDGADAYRWLHSPRDPRCDHPAENAIVARALAREPGILDLERVRVFVDSEDPRVIWGWLATSPDESVVHEVVLKRSLYETTDQGLRDFARRLLRSALGPHLQRPTGHVGSMHVLRKLEMLPRSWFFDTLYFLKRHECKTK